jgi:uncharacterized protein YwqG
MSRADEINPELVAELSPLIDSLLPRLGRTSWQPRTVEDDGGDLGTRYGGRPWIGFGFAWPSCPLCQQPMQLFVQIDLAELPPELEWPHRDGLVQLFYCTTVRGSGFDLQMCEVEGNAWDAFARTMVVRHVPAERVAAAAGLARLPPNADQRHLPGWRPSRVIGWERQAAELPGYEERVWETIEEYEECCYDLHDVMRARDVAPRVGDKLGGWPAWVQSPRRPSCPRCKKAMQVLLQVESNGHSGHQFGDLGAGHVSQCPQHVDAVAFAWSGH